mgnify:CR=1 FL=1|jgi:predicted DNA-binding transcriptional regulator AlpA
MANSTYTKTKDEIDISEELASVFLNREKASAFLDLSLSTFDALVKGRVLHPGRTLGSWKVTRWHRRELEDWVLENCPLATHRSREAPKK